MSRKGWKNNSLSLRFAAVILDYIKDLWPPYSLECIGDKGLVFAHRNGCTMRIEVTSSDVAVFVASSREEEMRCVFRTCLNDPHSLDEVKRAVDKVFLK